MKNYIFTLGAFGIGVAAGFAVAALILKKRYEKRMQEELAAIEDTNKLVSEKRKAHAAANNDDDGADNDVRDIEADNDAHGASEPPSDWSEYTSIADGYSAKGFQPTMTCIHNISPEEYEEINGYAKRNVCFYEADEVAICNETGVELDLDEDLGNDLGCLNEDNAADDGMIYIRNPKYSTDYAIDIYPGGVAGLQD